MTTVPTSLSEIGFLFGPGLTADGATWMCRQLMGLLAVDGVAVTVTAGYRRDRHPWTTPEVAAIESAGRLLTFALATMRSPGIDEDNRAWIPRVAVEVAQATGIVMGAMHLSTADALSRLRAAAFVAGRLLTDIAADVVAGRPVPFLDEAAKSAPGERIGS